MARTRIISQNKYVFAARSTGIDVAIGLRHNEAAPLTRVDSASFEVDIAGARVDVREFGRLARIDTLLNAADLNATLSLGYYLKDGWNEHVLGFNSSGINNARSAASQFISHALSADIDSVRNIWIATIEEGEDAYSNVTYFSGATQKGGPTSDNVDIVGFGNATPTNYSLSLAVGEIPRADVEFEAQNILFENGYTSGLRSPSIKVNASPYDDTWALPSPSDGDVGLNDDLTVLRPGDLEISIAAIGGAYGLLGGVDVTQWCPQSVTLDLPLSRTAQECLASKRPVANDLDLPITATLSVTSQTKEYVTGELAHYLKDFSTANANQDITVTMKKNDGTVALELQFKNAVLDSQSISTTLDDNETVDLVFSTQLGGAVSTTDGVFMSGDWATFGSTPSYTPTSYPKPNYL